MDTKELYSQMQKAWDELKKKLDDRDAEIKKFGDASQETKNAIDKLNNRIAEIETKMSRPGAPTPGAGQGQKGGEPTIEQKAFDSYLRQGKQGMAPDELKALSTQSDTEGGFVVTEDFREQLFQKLRDNVYIRQYATTISTQKGSVGVPTFDYDGDAEWTAENAQIGEENFLNVFGKMSFTPHKLARIFRVPIELIEDTFFDIEGFLTDHFARRFGEIEENSFLNGDGNNKPLGLLNATDQFNKVTSTAAALKDLTADDLINAQYAVKAQYRNRGVWLMHRDVVKQVRLIKTTDGQFLWSPGLQPGQPASLLSRPVLESEYMPVAAAGQTAALYGDLSYYWIVDRTNLAVQRLTEKYAEYDQVGVKLRKRTDAAPTLGEPFAVINLAEGV